MRVLENPTLSGLNTFGVEARAALRIDIENEEDVLNLPDFDPARDLVLGGGSNVLLASDVPGTLYLNRIRGRAIVERTDDVAFVETGAGENWHELVCWSIEQGLSGLENLSLIPGSAGAAPMQNIGAYGVELSSVVDSVTAWDWHKKTWRVFEAEECAFAYRDSRFKSVESGRYLITSMRLALRTRFEPCLDYSGLAQELVPATPGSPTPREVSDAVIRIRRRKLPDPGKTPNAGSFFKNPVLLLNEAERITAAHPDLPTWPAVGGGMKLSAAWMIEHCGLKGFSMGAAAVSEQHALVLVNTGRATGAEIHALARKVRSTVLERFGVELEPEPAIIEFS